MSDGGERRYRMTLSLSVLKHLGFGLYSNVPAVLSEAVANAWDADARNVSIEIDANPWSGKITIQDDGHGMTVADANERYLHVGYERRKAVNGARTPKLDRPVMGRKGIGKLSLFSIARTVEVHSVRESERHGFRMDARKIEEAIKDGDGGEYFPDSVSSSDVDLEVGTRIVLTGLKRKLHRSSKALRRRLARRFSIIGPSHGFEIELDGQPITIEDREYHDKVQYIWTFGNRGNEFASVAETYNLERHSPRQGMIEVDGETFEVDGWIGTAAEAGQLKDQDTKESINKIVVMVRNKLAQEDILEEFGEGGVYSKYIMGEIHANFLDLDDQDDIATTSRQRIIEDDPRYEALRSKLIDEVKVIQSEWTKLRNRGGTDVAMTIPQIKEWFAGLNADHRNAAEKLFGRINRLPIDDFKQKRQLFISSILAFESLKFRNLLHRLEEISIEDLDKLKHVFIQLDDLEASAYYQISRQRLDVIRALSNLVDDDAKERALQEHLYKHLWLLDPSWERATHTEHMETRVYKALQGVNESLTEDEKLSRIDIHYTTTGKKHVIIELKRASRLFRTGELVDQITRYRTAVSKVLETAGKIDESVEIICVVGRSLKDWDSPNGRKVSRDTLAGSYARVVLYDELIQNAFEAYQDYVSRENEAGRVYQLISSISSDDAWEISPDSL